MFRIKVALTMVIVFAAVGAFLYVTFSDAAATDAQARVEQRLRVATRALVRVRRLRDSAIVAKAGEVADWPQVAQILTKPIESFADETGTPPSKDDFAYQIHRLMNEEVKVWRTKFESLATGQAKPSIKLADWLTDRPDLFLVTDSKGVGVANARDPAWFGPKEANILKERPALQKALDGETLKDLWLVKGAPTAVGVVPVRRAGKVVGLVILGFRLTDTEVQRAKGLVETDVGYFLDGRLNQSTSLDSTAEGQLQTALAEQKLANSGSEKVVEILLGGKRYLGMVGKLSGYASAKNAGVISLESLDAALLTAGEPLIWIPVACALGLLIVLGLFIVFFQMFMKPFEQLDQGVMEIINGNLDHWFEIEGKELPGTMSQNLNIMVCHLSGRPLPDEEDRPAGAAWAGDRMFSDAMGGSSDSSVIDLAAVQAGNTAGIAPAILALVQEEEAAYQRRLFREYTEAMRNAGQPIQGITFEAFTAQLQNNAQGLTKKYDCTQVRFVVSVDGKNVRLRPVPIR